MSYPTDYKEPLPQGEESKKRFLFVNKSFSRNYEYIDDADHSGDKDRTPAFVVPTASFPLGKPDLTLRAGPDDKSLPVASAYLPGFSKTFKIGLGDAVNAKDRVRWEKMKYKSFFSKTLLWSMNLPSGKRLNLRWSPTSHHAVDGKSPSKVGQTNWKLVDVSAGDTIIGVFTGQHGISRLCGTLQINVDWGREFDFMVLMTMAAIYEKVKRTQKAVVRAAT